MSGLDLVTPSELLPGITARGLATAYTDALVAPLVEIDGRVTEIVLGIEDLAEAGGGILDLLGDWASEPRGGLSDGEYRRIIAGRRVALERTVERPAIWRGWVGLTEPLQGAMDEAPNEVSLTAWVTYQPSTAWVQRVAGVARELVSGGAYVYGLIAPPGTYLWGTNSFDDAGFAFDFGA